MKRTYFFYAMICFFVCFGPRTLFSQNDLGFYNMQIVPQRIFLNPAFIPEQKLYIGIPVLSGIQTSFANPFSYNDLIEKDAYDSISLQVDNFVAKLAKNDQLRFYSDVDILSLGSQVSNGRFFLGFSIRERLCQHIMIPENLGNFLWYGNASPQVFGKEVNISPSLNFTAFDEWAVSFSGYAMKRKISWGGRIKYLSGRFNVTTSKSDFRVFTDTGTYALNMWSDLEIRTSGIDNIENYLDKPVSKLVFPGNNGAGIDLGATYQVNDHITLNASVLDIGFIKWKSETLTLVSQNPGAEFSFKGFKLEDFMDMVGDLDSFGRKVTDSILDLVELDSVYDTKYTTWLPVRYNLGGSYSLNIHHSFNLLLNGVSWNSTFHPALSVSYYYNLPRILGIMVSYNLFNNQYTNIGAGLSVNAGPLQLYAVSDNVPALLFYRGSNNYSVRFGINIAINKNKNPSVPMPEEEATQSKPTE